MTISLSTADTVPGKEIQKSLGLLRASTVQARNIGSDIGAGLKSLVGGKIGGYEKLLRNAREDVLQDLGQQAAKIGADAIVALRITTSQVMDGASEVLAYGTAVKLKN